MNYNKLETLCIDIIDCPHSTPKWLDAGIRIIRNYNLKGANFDFSRASYVDEETYINRTKRATPQANDIIISREAPIGTVAIIPEGLKCCLGQRLVLLKVNSEKVNPHYLLYTLMSQYVQKQIKKIGVKGSIASSLNIPDLKELSIPICERSKQDKIANLLMCIDEKIRINNQIYESLQLQSSHIYMHLFFEKNANGRISDILIENPKSSIQVGEAKIAKGIYQFFTSGETVYEWSEPLISGRNCFLNTGGNADVKFYVGLAAYSTDTWCITAKNDLSDYLYLLLNSIKVELNNKFFQGTGLRHLQKKLFKDKEIYIPIETEIKSFNKVINPMLNMMSEKKSENKELVSLRDWLIDILISGEVIIE